MSSNKEFVNKMENFIGNMPSSSLYISRKQKFSLIVSLNHVKGKSLVYSDYNYFYFFFISYNYFFTRDKPNISTVINKLISVDLQAKCNFK